LIFLPETRIEAENSLEQNEIPLHKIEFPSLSNILGLLSPYQRGLKTSSRTKNKIIPPTLIPGHENHSFKIYNKYSIYFAYKTSHPCEIKIISDFFKSLIDKQIALFKSPTDMGKSLVFFRQVFHFNSVNPLPLKLFLPS
jgi:hypothetical protein